MADTPRSWLVTLIGYVVLYVSMSVQQWWAVTRSAAERAEDRAHATRDVNEVKAFAWLAAPEPPHGTATVRATDLAALYRDGFAAADRAYKGRRVTVPLRQYRVVGNEVHWHLGDPTAFPPVVVFAFDGVPGSAPGGVLWITGTCSGASRDGQRREYSGYDFVVRIADCEVTNPKE